MPRSNPHRSITDDINLPRRIAIERNRRDMSYEALAKEMERVGCPIQGSAIYRIEKGNPARRVTVDELLALMEVFGLSFEEITTPVELLEQRDAKSLVDEINTSRRALVEAFDRQVEAWARYHHFVSGVSSGDVSDFVSNHLNASKWSHWQLPKRLIDAMRVDSDEAQDVLEQTIDGFNKLAQAAMALGMDRGSAEAGSQPIYTSLTGPGELTVASIEKRERGGRVRWYARYRDDADKQRVKVFDRRVDAEKYLTTVGAALLTDSYVDPRAGALTVAEFYAVWSTQQIWTTGTEKAMSLAVRTSTFANVRLRDLRPSHLEAWVKAMTTKGLAPGTIRTRFNNLHSLLRAAVRDRMIASDPAENIRLPRGRSREAAMTVPTPEQVGRLVASADDPFRAFVALCAFAGLRLGEAASIQVRDIDFLRRTLAVRRQVQRADRGSVEIRPPKYGSERTVYLGDGLLTLLAQHVESGVHGPDGWLFRGDNGNPPHQNSVGYWWRRAKTSAGVGEMRLHDLRHFYASGLIAEGCDVVTVQRALGHKSATTTLNTYSHLWPSAEDRTRAASGRIFAAAFADVYPSCTEAVSDAT